MSWKKAKHQGEHSEWPQYINSSNHRKESMLLAVRAVSGERKGALEITISF
jgi:hypothetical protein